MHRASCRKNRAEAGGANRRPTCTHRDEHIRFHCHGRQLRAVLLQGVSPDGGHHLLETVTPGARLAINREHACAVLFDQPVVEFAWIWRGTSSLGQPDPPIHKAARASGTPIFAARTAARQGAARRSTHAPVSLYVMATDVVLPVFNRRRYRPLPPFAFACAVRCASASGRPRAHTLGAPLLLLWPLLGALLLFAGLALRPPLPLFFSLLAAPRSLRGLLLRLLARSASTNSRSASGMVSERRRA